MKKLFLGALVLVAALVMTGCENKNQKKENTNEMTEETANRLLIIVDPQIDFTTGSLATAKGPSAMDYLAKAINKGAWKAYQWIVITQDAHPKNHCSFVEQGGPFPPHCVQGTEGMNVYPALDEALCGIYDIGRYYLQKGDLPDKEEFSIFQNEDSGTWLTDFIKKNDFDFFQPFIAAGKLTVADMHHAAQRYHLGKTKSGQPMYWMIDDMLQPLDAHIGQDAWISQLLKKREPLLSSWQVHHCLFGLHLLTNTNLTNPTNNFSAVSAVSA